MADSATGAAIRRRFDLVMPAEDRLRLRALAAADGKTESAVLRELVRQAASRRHEEIARRIFGTAADPPDEAA